MFRAHSANAGSWPVVNRWVGQRRGVSFMLPFGGGKGILVRVWRISGWWQTRHAARAPHRGMADAQRRRQPPMGEVMPGALLRERSSGRLWRLDRLLDGPAGERYAILLPAMTIARDEVRTVRGWLVRIGQINERMEPVMAGGEPVERCRGRLEAVGVPASLRPIRQHASGG
ncbi:MAG: hypothetical protein D6757_03365 [Alphaproteobacteria bacterium]|nr:MAG: hypothetical protein D6757_03365 [Alphaproteobacteria bacterium]